MLSEVPFTLWQGGWRATPKRKTLATAKDDSGGQLDLCHALAARLTTIGGGGHVRWSGWGHLDYRTGDFSPIRL
jgi:hypothetical protein